MSIYKVKNYINLASKMSMINMENGWMVGKQEESE